MASNISSGQDTTTPSSENLRADYEQTNQQINMLADIRFKLLTFVPTLTAAAVALLTNDKVGQGTVLVVGLLGFFAVLGIVMYDQRNSQIYDVCQHRARFLEKELHLPSSFNEEEGGGLFTEKPARTRRLFRITVWHDRSLAYIYGTALGGWSYIIISPLLSIVFSFFHWQRFPLLNQPADVAYIVSIFLAALIACLFIRQFQKMENT